MKTVVFILALLAGLKLGHQEYVFRTATSDVIVAAYKERAIQACQKDARSAFLGVLPQAWANAVSVKLAIGRGGLDVYFWQVDNDQWNARYRNPFLVLTVGARTGQARCEYDIVNAAVSVHRL